MNSLRNKVQLIGNLGNDPEIIMLENGTKLAKFSIATNESYKNAKGEKVTDTQWHNIVAWGKLAEITEGFLSKGKEVMIEGIQGHDAGLQDQAPERAYHVGLEPERFRAR